MKKLLPLFLLCFAITASAQSGVREVQFFLDGVAFGPVITVPPYTFQWDSTTVRDGVHAITARATDNAGNSSTSGSVSVTVDNTAPMVTISAPTSGATVTGKININAAAVDLSFIGKMDLRIDGVVKMSVANSSLSYYWNTAPYKRSAPKIEVSATDKAGHVTTSAIQVHVP